MSIIKPQLISYVVMENKTTLLKSQSPYCIGIYQSIEDAIRDIVLNRITISSEEKNIPRPATLQRTYLSYEFKSSSQISEALSTQASVVFGWVWEPHQMRNYEVHRTHNYTKG
jgi:hypothetical protein